MTDKVPSIHRESEVTRLRRLFTDIPRDLSICGVSGPGGVGKTYLVENVLESIDLAKEGFLTLSVNGADRMRANDFLGLVEGQLAARSLPAPAGADKDYFPQIREVSEIHRKLIDQAAAELTQKGAPTELKECATALLRSGQVLNALVPKSQTYFNASASTLSPEKVDAFMDAAWEQVRALNALRDSTLLPGPLRDVVGITRRNLVKRNLYGAVAEALLSDLSAAIAGYREQDRFKLFLQRRIPGIQKLLIIVDDYEVLAPTLSEFLIGHLVPQLAKAEFPTMMIVLGRDRLDSAHPGWAQHCKRFIRDEIELKPFSREDAIDLLAQADVPEDRRAAIFESTQGFPFLLNLVIEEAGAHDGNSANFLRKFFDRTTRWMTDPERQWFVDLCYLDRVDEDTLAWIFQREQIRRVQEWFEREPSIRDPTAAFFCVRPLIREKVLRFQEVRSPSKHRQLMETVKSRQAAV